jgi:hypothetical protein
MRIQETTPREKAIFRRIDIRELEFWWLATEAMVKILQQCGDGVRGKIEWI